MLQHAVDRREPLLDEPVPAPYVLFSGHLDSWHLGAMDNGSANAVMVGVARELAKHRTALRRSLRLAFWSGHSHGRYARSAWYANDRAGGSRVARLNGARSPQKKQA